MSELKLNVESFLNDCRFMKGLSEKTMKAYTIDLRQFSEFCIGKEWNNKDVIEEYVKELYMNYKPKTARRKIACLKAFFHFLENADFLITSPFHKISIKRREPMVLPKVIPVEVLSEMLETAYLKLNTPNHSDCYYRYAIRELFCYGTMG